MNRTNSKKGVLLDSAIIREAVVGKELLYDPANKGYGNDMASDAVVIGMSNIHSVTPEAQRGGTPRHDLKSNGLPLLEITAKTAPRRLKLLSSLFFATMSVGIMMLTKTILTEFNFHCFIFVAFLQYATTTVVLLGRRYRGSISFPLHGFVQIVLVDLFPLPIVFLFNTLSGLGATQSLSMPLFVLLRRLSIIFTLIGEAVMLRYHHGWETHIAVLLMVVGAFIATSLEMRAPARGVAFVLLNDIFTAVNGVLTRMEMDENRFSSEGIMFYTNAFATCCSGLMLVCDVRWERTELAQFNGWTPTFLTMLAINAVSGFGISYATYLCMKLNSPLTVSMIGAGKNVFTSYVGMLFSDYTFSMPSFIGVNVSLVGCLLYSHREFVRIMQRQEGEVMCPPQRIQKKADP